MESKYLNHGEKTLIECINIHSDKLSHEIKEHLDRYDLLNTMTTDSIERLLNIDQVLELIWDHQIPLRDLNDYFDRLFKGFENWIHFLNSQIDEPFDSESYLVTQSCDSFDLLKSSLKVYNYIHNGGNRCHFDFSEEENDQKKVA